MSVSPRLVLKQAAGLLLCLLLLGGFRTPRAHAQSYNTTFANGDDGWVGSAVGYQPNLRKDYGISVYWNLFSNPITQGERTGLLFKGKNLNGDLFVYAFRQITGLKPNAVYQITFNATVYDLPKQSAKSGRICVKGGSLLKIPAHLFLYQVESNFDKGAFGKDGADLQVLDCLEVGATGSKHVVQNYRRPIEGRTNHKGELYLVIGFEVAPDFVQMPDLFLSFLRTTFTYQRPYESDEQENPVRLFALPNHQGFYFDTDWEADLSMIGVYSTSGHLIKVMPIDNPYYDHVMRTADLTPGIYQFVFFLFDGYRYTQEVHIRP